MKRTIFPLLIICIIGIIAAIGLPSCRRDKFQPTIKQYDSIQIVNYIAANHLTGFRRDTTGGDTSGLYYKILVPGSGTPLQYSDSVRFVYTDRTLDGTYTQADTIADHYSDYVGHIAALQYPLGLQTAIHNLMMYSNATMRVLIPSHLAYGVLGTGSGSSKVANNRIGGNESLDYYVHAINNFQAYDDLVIQNYMRDSSLTGYTKVQSQSMPGTPPNNINYYYYKILIPGTSTDAITANSTITATYTGSLFNATIFDSAYNGTNLLNTTVSTLIPGVQDALINYAVAGTKISMLIPSTLGYGLVPQTGVPNFSCLRFTWVISTVSP